MSDDLTASLGSGWKSFKDQPNPEPHRNIEVVTLDAIGQVFFDSVSSLIAGSLKESVMWRETLKK